MSIKTRSQQNRRVVSIPEPIYQALKSRAEMEGISLGYMIRELLRGAR